MGEVPFNPKAPHGVHTATGRIPVLDQNGLLYDGITQLEIEGTPDPNIYAVVDGMPFSKVTTEAERLETALSTIRASGAVDPDSMAKFEKMLTDIQRKQEVTVQKATVTKSVYKVGD